MMKKMFFLLMLFVIKISNAQDKLVDFNSNAILVKIIEVGDDYILFKKYDNIEGPDYKESKSNYSTVVFENGKVEVLNKKYVGKKDKSNRPRFKLVNNFKYNTIELDLLAFYTNDVLVQYTRFLKKKNIAITIPFRAGWIRNRYNGIYLIDLPNYYPESYYNNSSSYYYDNYNYKKSHGYKFLTGANFKFFWRDKYKVRGYAGPEFIVGFLSTKASNYNYSYYGNGSYYQYRYTKGFIGLMGTVGMIAQPTNMLSFKLEWAGGFVGVLGKKNINYSNSYYSYNFYNQKVRGIGRMTFSIGFNF
jgi:hypothetical protein